MATATIAQVRLVTGWTTTEISNDDLTTLLGLASDEISAYAPSGADSNLVKMAEIYKTAELGEMALKGADISSISQGGTAITYNSASSSAWAIKCKEILSGLNKAKVKKVY